MTKRFMAVSIIITILLAVFSLGCERQRGRKVTNLEYGSDMLIGGKAFQSIDYLEKAQEEEPNNPLVYAYLVIAYRRAKDTSAAKVAGRTQEFERKERETFERLRSLGEVGMKALLKVATGRNRLMTDAIDLLVEYGDLSVKPIINFLTNSHNRSRYPDLMPFLKEALVKIGNPASNALCATLNRSDLPTEVEKDLVEVLGEIGDPDALLTLEKCASATDPVVRMESIIALYRLGRKEYTAQILKALDDPNVEVRRLASRALLLINHVPEKVIVKKLNDEDPVVRANVIKVLDKKPPESLKGRLMKILSSDLSDEVQNAAAEALKGYGSSIAGELIDMLPKEKEWDVRLRIVEILETPEVAKGIDNDGEYKLYEAYRKEKKDIVKDRLAQLLDKL
ncbi:TPA: HEAT repeat domain-containing protein [Candidatus Poribacteria bacterium]|nr:HEAT repeat domain-containing protein [Candidatus Poribacteria bacterium]